MYINLLGLPFGMPWVSLGSLWDAIGLHLGVLGPFLVPFGVPWGALGLPLGCLGALLGALGAISGRSLDIFNEIIEEYVKHTFDTKHSESIARWGLALAKTKKRKKNRKKA